MTRISAMSRRPSRRRSRFLATGDRFPIPLGPGTWVAYWDAWHGVSVIPATQRVTQWQSRVGSAVLAPVGNAPLFAATGSITGGPTLQFLATNLEYLTSTNAALIAAFAGDDLPCTVVARASAASSTVVCSASLPSASTTYFFFARTSGSLWQVAKRSAGDSVTSVTQGTFSTEEAVAAIHNGTATEPYCDGWGASAPQNNGTMAALTTFVAGANLRLAGSIYLTGVITALGVAATALTQAQVDVVRAAQALL